MYLANGHYRSIHFQSAINFNVNDKMSVLSVSLNLFLCCVCIIWLNNKNNREQTVQRKNTVIPVMMCSARKYSFQIEKRRMFTIEKNTICSIKAINSEWFEQTSVHSRGKRSISRQCLLIQSKWHTYTQTHPCSSHITNYVNEWFVDLFFCSLFIQLGNCKLPLSIDMSICLLVATATALATNPATTTTTTFLFAHYLPYGVAWQRKLYVHSKIKHLIISYENK